MILVAMFTALTAIGAFIKIPVGPAPITLQFLFTALAGIMLGSRLGALSQLVYVVLGLIGIPIFTSGGGISYIFKPTFGYLIGYIIGAYVIGKIAESVKKPSYVRLLVASLIGVAVVYIIGVPYLYVILKYVVGAKITVMGALKAGMILFIPGDIAKCIITAALAVKVVPIVRKAALV
jgi:Uncharacterized conserved protein